MNKKELSEVYLDAAEKVFERNQYTCFMELPYNVLSAYRNMLSPLCIEGSVPDANNWWSYYTYMYVLTPTLKHKKKIAYAHQARVFALLFASEMAKTGDIKIKEFNY